MLYSLPAWGFKQGGRKQQVNLLISINFMANDNKNKQAEENNNQAGEEKKEQVKKTKLTRVRFLKSKTPYIKGDVAGLEPEEAQDLIKAKICEKA